MDEQLEQMTDGTTETVETDIGKLTPDEIEARLSEATAQGEPEVPTTETDQPVPEAAAQGEGEPQEEKPHEENVTLTRKEHDDLRKKIENQEKFNQRLATELGLLRKQNPVDYAQRIQGIRDEFFTDPVGAMEHYNQIKREMENQQLMEKQAEVSQRMQSTRDQILTFVPEFEASVDDIGKLMTEDGETQDFVKYYRKNPWILPPATNVNLHKRASLVRENAILKGELDTLRGKVKELEGKPDRILKGIEKAVSQPKPLNGGNGQVVTHSPIAKRIEDMTPAEIESALEAQLKLEAGG